MTNADSTQDPKRPHVILAAVDASSSASLVVRMACELANAGPSILHLVHVEESLRVGAVAFGGSPLALPSAAQLLRNASVELERYTNEAQQETAVDVHSHLRVGAPVREILQLASDLEADVLVIGTHDAKGFERLLLGSIAEVIARTAPCAVLVARKRTAHRKDIPEITPPCPDCLRARSESKGKAMWCERHAEHHPRAHTYSEMPEGYGAGAALFKEV